VGKWLNADSRVEGNGGRPGPYDAATGDANGSGWSRYGDQRDYLNEPISSDDLPAADGGEGRTGRHRGGRAGRPVRATLWSYEGQQVGQAPARRDPRMPYGPPIVPGTAEPPDRLDDYWLAGSRAHPPVTSRPLDYPPAAYQESFRVSVPGESDLPATRMDRAVPAVSHNGAVRPRERVRGMNAALETGVAGVGEMAPARKPARPRQMVLAVVVAIIGLVAGALTYKSLATGPVSFSGEVVPTHVYALSFGAAGTITAVKVDAGDHVTAGEVLATQDDGLAQASLQAARDDQAAAAAALYADEHPQQSSVTREQDAVTAAQASVASATARASRTGSRDKAIISQRQLAVTRNKSALASQCGTATTSATCQALAAKLTTAQQELTQAQDAAAADNQAGLQQEQAAQSQLGERQAALQQVQSQAGGVNVTLDQAKQRLAAAKVTVAQDEIALKGKSVIAPAVGTVGAVSAAAGDDITDSSVHNPVLTVDSGPLIVSASLPGTAIGAVRVGQPVTLDIQPLHLSLPGRVVQINQVASQSQTAVSYTVICQIDAQGTALMAGMTVNITPQ
jgi:multidrug efflux pump subunit AcrA (membrane-fusion protein)